MWSKDGLRFPSDDFRVCVPCRDDGDEHRVGRPYVFEAAGRLHMFFGAGTRSKLYRLAYAWSTDGGLTWKRDDAALGISESADGWDAMMMGYPAVVSWKDRTYLFYNGNDMGRAGFGYAELEAW